MHVHDEQARAELSKRNRGTNAAPSVSDCAVRQLMCVLQRARALKLDARISVRGRRGNRSLAGRRRQAEGVKMTTLGCSEAIRLLSGSALMSLMSSVAADVEIEARARTTFSRLAQGGKVVADGRSETSEAAVDN